MNTPPAITCLFIDIGGVLLTNGWDHLTRKQAASHFKLDWAEMEEQHQLNSEQANFRVFGPDETLSNGLEALFDVTNRQWGATTVPNDEFLAPSGRVLDSMLSEHQCEGWLEGYLLTGRHGVFNCYEAFIHIIDSMFNQHAK